MSEDRLALSITRPDGPTTRWGPDESDGSRVPTDLQFGTAVPGGFTTLSSTMLRNLQPQGDEGLFFDVRAYGAGNRTAWHGRMAQLPRTNTQLKPAAVGYSSHLMDDPSFMEIYADPDKSHWGPPSVQRQKDLAGSYAVQSFEVLPDATTGNPSLKTAFTGPWNAAPGLPISEALYDSAGIPIGALYYAWAKNAQINPADTSWSWSAGLGNGDRFLTYDGSGELRAAGPGSGTVTASAGDRIFAVVDLLYNAAGADSREYAIYWSALVVYGNHGLTLVPIAGTAPGIVGTDAVANIVTRTAPMLNFTTGPNGSIVANSFVFSSLVFREPVTGSDAIALINGSYLWEWGVYEDKQFFFRPPAQTNVWEARLGSGAQLSLEGDQSDDLYNGVVVTFTDANGRKMKVGPPGWTPADATDTRLVDTDPTNPVNAAGIPVKWAKLDLSVITDTAGAIQIGAVFLAQQQLARRRGSITLTGPQTLRGQAGTQPPWAARAGDWVTVVDRPDEPLRRMISTSYVHRERAITSDLDNTSQKLDAILERLGVGQIGRV